MPATLAEKMVAKLEALLLENAGLTSVTVDGVSTTFDDLTAQYAYWKKQVASEQGRSRTVSTIIVGGKT
jgi:hypothetical protein